MIYFPELIVFTPMALAVAVVIQDEYEQSKDDLPPCGHTNIGCTKYMCNDG